MEASINISYFLHYTGLVEPIYDFIYDGLKDVILTARNVRFEYDEDTNNARKRRPSKLSAANRIIVFLHALNEGITKFIIFFFFCLCYVQHHHLCMINKTKQIRFKSMDNCC